MTPQTKTEELIYTLAGRTNRNRNKRRANRGIRMHPEEVNEILKGVNEKMATPQRRGPRRPTLHYVREAVNAHIGRDLTSATATQWIRREHGVSLRQGSVSGALGQLMKETDQFILTRIALGVYHVEAAGRSAGAPTASENGTVPTTANPQLGNGDMLEVVHTTRDGSIWARDDDDNLYVVRPKS